MSSKAHAAFKRLDNPVANASKTTAASPGACGSGAAEAVGFAGHYRFFSTRDNYGVYKAPSFATSSTLEVHLASLTGYSHLFATSRSTIRSTIGQLVFTFVV